MRIGEAGEGRGRAKANGAKGQLEGRKEGKVKSTQQQQQKKKEHTREKRNHTHSRHTQTAFQNAE